MGEQKKALFLDRDGVIIEDSHLLTDFKNVKILSDVPKALKSIRQLGYMTILVTNQTVISRGLLSVDETLKLNQMILDAILKIDSEAIIDDVFLCPHHPNATDERYKLLCECRKPKSGMLYAAARKHNIDLTQSFMVGDRVSDIIAGNRANCTTIQLLTGQDSAKLIETNLQFDQADQTPDFKTDSLIKILTLL